MSVHHRSSNDKWVKCISSSGTIRAIAITATEITQFLIDRHAMKNEAGIKAFAESSVAALLLSSYCKSGEKVNLNIQGSGWCHHTIIDANADGELRGYIVERNQADIKLAKNIGPWGIGLMSVLRTKTEESQPYIGTVPLLTGHLAKDLTFYWLQSEQVQSAVGIDVIIENGKIILAEGFLIQALPGATDADLDFIEDHIKKLHQYDSKLELRKTPIKLLSYLLENQTFSVLDEKNLSAHCPCSIERVKRSLVLVGTDELKSMLDEKKDVEVVCDFCSEKYIFSVKMIEAIILENQS